MKTKNYILIMLLIFLSNNLFAQVKKEEVIFKHKNGSPSFIMLKETKVSFNKAATESFLKKQFNLNNNVSFQTKKEDVDLGITIQKQQQYYKDIKVEFGEVVLAGKNNVLNHISGNVLEIENLNTNPTLTKESALNIALQKIGSQEYAWQNIEMENFRKQLKGNPDATYYPKSELVIVDKNILDSIHKPILAYKMDIYSTNPLKYSYYYIDAINGEIILENPIINHVEGIASTRYSGTRTIETEAVGSSYKLKDNTRGDGIITYNLNNSWDYSSPTNFTDNDNNWTVAEYNNTNKDNAALDAHWGAEMTYDYFLNNFNRNSYDNNGGIIKGYVHYGTNYPGAFWNGNDKIMTYGDGVYPRDVVVSLDVVGHEIAHGITNHEVGTDGAGMWSFYEPGAIEESISDIWGAMVEHYTAPEKSTYLIAEDIYLNGKHLRSMANPKSVHSHSRQPNTYLGEFYHPETNPRDNGGVHTNSGIMNNWFYLLAEGGNGINDNGDTYFFSGIGKENAAKIVYRAVKYYFNSTTTFYQARELTMQAAADLFGEVTTIKAANAWYAVGVGNFIPYGSHYISGPTQITPGTGGMYTLNPYVGATHYQWVIPTGCTNTYYCWEVVQGQGTNTALIHGGDIGRHDIICKIYSNNHLMDSQSIRVNVQNPYNGGSGNGNNPCGDLGNFNGLIYPPEPCDDGNGIAATESYFSELIVYDMSGRKVLALNNVDSVDLNNLANGLYIIKAKLNTNKVITKKILK